MLLQYLISLLFRHLVSTAHDSRLTDDREASRGAHLAILLRPDLFRDDWTRGITRLDDHFFQTVGFLSAKVPCLPRLATIQFGYFLLAYPLTRYSFVNHIEILRISQIAAMALLSELAQIRLSQGMGRRSVFLVTLLSCVVAVRFLWLFSYLLNCHVDLSSMVMHVTWLSSEKPCWPFRDRELGEE